MSNFSDYISSTGGGGANTYTPSTATAGIDVVAGSSYALSSSSQLLPSSSVLAEEANAVLNDFKTSSESNYYYQPSTISGDRYLPDGSNLIWYGRQNYDIRITLSKDGTSRFSPQYATVISSTFSSSLEIYQKNIGQTANDYLVAYRLHYYSTSGGPWKSQAGILKINKTTGVITHNILGGNMYATPKSIGYNWVYAGSPERNGNQHTCRGGTVYVDTYFVSSTGLVVAAQPLDSTGSPTGSSYYGQQSGVSGWNAGLVGNLIKIDDANGIFLHFYPLDSSNLRVAKVTVASTGAVTTSTLETYSQYSGIDQYYERSNAQVYGGGTGTNNLYITFSQYSSGVYNMLGTYDLSDDSITWGTNNFTSYGTGFTYSRNSNDWRVYKNQRTYDADNKLFYMGGEFNSGNGFVLNPATNTITAAELNNKLSSVSNLQDFQMYYNGGVISFGDRTSGPYTNSAHYAFSFDSSLLLTRDAVAVVLASGSAGSTVNIALKDGITSSSTLPSTHYLSKSDLYFPYAVEGVSATSVIKSVQRGLIAYGSPAEQTVTISAVDVNKSMVVVNGWGYHGASNTGGYGTTFLTNGTTLTFNTNTSSYTKRFSWQVIEYV